MSNELPEGLVQYCTQFSETIRVSQQQKGKLFHILVWRENIGWQWHQLDLMEIICTSLQIDNRASISSFHFFAGRMLFLTQPRESK